MNETSVVVLEGVKSGMMGVAGDPEIRLNLFAKLWALAVLFHQAKPVSWVGSVPETVLTLASFFVLLTRVTVPRLALFLAIQVWAIWTQFPWPVTNHWILAFFVCLAGLLALAGVAGRSRARAPEAKGWLAEFSPAARIQLLLLYAFATFHKLNSGYLDTRYSCASEHYLALRALIPSLPDAAWAKVVAIGGSLAAEGSIPLLLLFTRTRLLGVCLALVFHTVVGLNNFFDFSAIVFALLLFFLPQGFERRIGGRLPALPEIWAAIAAGVLTLLTANLPGPVSQGLGVAAGAVYGTAFLALVLWEARRRREPFSLEPRAFSPGPLGAAPVALLVLNGFSPYLGLKTESSFAMFSNLQTEGGRSNHLFMPSYQPFDFQKELVQLQGSDDERLGALLGRWVPYAEVRLRYEESVLRGHPIRVRYVTRNGNPHVLEGPALASAAPSPYLLRKLLVFRTLEAPGVPSCGH